ncbi:MAG: MarR family winged helix-turn-helix transcriptional regulator [Thermoleophilia bacterium]
MQTDGGDLPLPESLLRVAPFVMLQLVRAGRRLAERMPAGARLPQVAVLACLEEFGPQSQREVGRRLRFDPSDMVRIVDLLERDGHVARRRDPDDRRRYALAPTAAGRRWLGERLDAIESRPVLLAGLDEAERERLLQLLVKALAHVDGRVPQESRAV